MDNEAIASMWSRGDYGIVGDWFGEASRSCLTGMELTGRKVLDIACGTGAVAIEAAGRGAEVTALDITPRMLEEASQRARLAGVEIRFAEGSFTDLAAYRDFDVATSAFGVMFAEDQAAMAGEVMRTLRPGGRAVIASWHPEGLLGFPFPGIEGLLPPMGEGPDRGRWATTSGLASILAELQERDPQMDVRLHGVEIRTVDMPFPSVDDAVSQMRALSCGWMMLFEALAGHGTEEAGQQALIEHVDRFPTPAAHGVDLSASYGLAHLSRT
ncbi:class I SAM-dependent methyltransferase [Euzebya tangerina]|uniref:class I SAM-dependent methyltransferase n=1 Tax=Euzebya tangerina TaxID=591198 RepID=UPI000E31543A|nr:class I SAM-dependent methyltransferase [Euzebya tangerina]